MPTACALYGANAESTQAMQVFVMNEHSRKGRIDGAKPAQARPTLKTISKETGLAVATVSRALNDAPDIGQDTKKRVHEVARQLGYRPNRAGVRLRTGKTNVISLVISTQHEMVNQHTGRLISSIAGALRNTPYHMIVTPYFPSEDVMEPINYILETGSADAIIINQTEEKDRRIRHLMDQKFPFVTHGRTMWADEHAYFDFDNYRFAQIGVSQFVRRGRRNIAVLAPPSDQYYAHHIVQGALDAGKAHDIEVTILDGATSDSTPEEIEEAIIAYRRANPELDAILSPSTLACMSITTAMETFGLRVGRDYDVFGKQTGRFLEQYRPGILSVIEDVHKTGEFLARAALHRISHPDAAPMQELDIPKY